MVVGLALLDMTDIWASCKPCTRADITKDALRVDLSNFSCVEEQRTDSLRIPSLAAEETKRCEAEEEALRFQRAVVAARLAAEAARRRLEAEREASQRAAREEMLQQRQEQAARQESAKERRQETLAEEAKAATEAPAEDLQATEAATEAATAAATEAPVKKDVQSSDSAEAAEEGRLQLQAQEAMEWETRRQLQEALLAVQKWCKNNGFQDVHSCKKTMRGATKFPLHTAVKYNNPGIVRMMLLIGGQKEVLDSRGRTPMQLARDLNQGGSYDELVAVLS